MQSLNCTSVQQDVTIQQSYIEVRGTRPYIILRVERCSEISSKNDSKSKRKNKDLTNRLFSSIYGGFEITRDLEQYIKNSGFHFRLTPQFRYSIGLCLEQGSMDKMQEKIAGVIWNDSAQEKANTGDVYFSKFMKKRDELAKEKIRVMQLNSDGKVSNKIKIAQELSHEDHKISDVRDLEDDFTKEGRKDLNYLKAEDLTPNEYQKFIESQDQICGLIDNQIAPKRIIFLKIFGNFIFIWIYVITIFEFFYTHTHILKFRGSIVGSENAQSIRNDFGGIGLILQYISAMNYNEVLTSNQSALFSNRISTDISRIKKAREEIFDTPFYNLFRENEAVVTFMQGKPHNFSLIEITEQLLAKSVEMLQKVKNSNISAHNFDSSFDFVIRNSINSFWKKISNITEMEYNKIGAAENASEHFALLILVISIIFQMVTQLLLTKTVSYVSQYNKKLMSIFFCIPENIIKLHTEKIELFRISIQQEENLIQDSLSNQNDISEDDDHSIPGIRISKKKKLKSDTKANMWTLILMYFFGITVISYCSICYLHNMMQLDWLSRVVPQHKAMHSVEGEITLMFNSYLSVALYNGTYPAALKEALEFEEKQRLIVINTVKNMIEINLKNIDLSSNEYLKFYDRFLYGDYFMNSSLVQIEKGDKYPDEIRKGALMTISTIVDSFIEQNRSLPLSNSVIKAMNAWNDLIIPSIQLVNVKLRENMKSYMESVIFFRIAFFGSYLFLLAILYFIVWLPSYSKVTDDYSEALQMLKYIPTIAIERNLKVRVFLKKMMKKAIYN